MSPGGPCGGRSQIEAVDQWSQIRITLMRSRIRICIKVKSRTRIRIEVKSRFRIRVKVMRIRNLATGWTYAHVCLVSRDAEDGGNPVGGVEDPGNGRRVRVLHLHLHPDDDVVPPFCTNSQSSFFATQHETIFSSTKFMSKRSRPP